MVSLWMPHTQITTLISNGNLTFHDSGDYRYIYKMDRIFFLSFFFEVVLIDEKDISVKGWVAKTVLW